MFLSSPQNVYKLVNTYRANPTVLISKLDTVFCHSNSCMVLIVMHGICLKYETLSQEVDDSFTL